MELKLKIDSPRKDGPQSWIVISRSIDKCVTELPEENKKHSLQRSDTQYGATRRDETEGTIDTAFILTFVNDIADQAKEMERHIRCWKIDDTAYKIS